MLMQNDNLLFDMLVNLSALASCRLPWIITDCQPLLSLFCPGSPLLLAPIMSVVYIKYTWGYKRFISTSLFKFTDYTQLFSTF